MSTPIIFKENSIVPDEFLKLIIENDNGGDFSFAITDSPMFLFLILEGISPLEQKAVINGKFELGSTVIDGVPFLTLDYGNDFVFDFTIMTMKELSDPNQNVINIILVEKKGFVVKGMRVLGVEPELIEVIQQGVKENNKDEAYVVNNIYAKYTSQDIHNCAKKQLFEQKNH